MMKKYMILGLVLSAMIIQSVPALAEESEPMVIAPSAAAADVLIGVPEISVNNETIDLSKANLPQIIFEENGSVMVPLRAVAEKMGYTVGWDEKNRAITVGNSEWEAVLYIDEDSYIGRSKTAIGMTAPQSYGTAPMLVGGTTFVPAKMFELMGYTYQSIGQFVDFVKKDAAKENVQIPNPFVTYENMETAKQGLSFEPAAPSALPSGYNLNEISLIGSNFLQIIYTDHEDNEIVYRMAVGGENISGDYNIYQINKEVKAGELTVTLHGNDKISNAVWKNGGFTFSVFTDAGLEESEVIELIQNIK